jgi:glycosyltransferase involved in cell wall biosynthesis
MLSGDTVLATGRKGVFHGVLAELARHFDRIDVIGPRPAAPVTTRALFGNVFLHPNPRGRLAQIGHVLRTARALIEERPYAICTSHDYGLFLNGIAAARLARETGLPYLSEIHHVPGHPRAVDLRERLEVVLNRWYARFAARRAVAIRVVNRIEMPRLLASFGVPAAKVRVIPSLYLDTDAFRPDPSVAKDVDVVLCGRLVKNKRFDLALDAVARLKERGRPVRVLLIGDGPLKGALLGRAARRSIAAQIEHVPYLDTTADLARAYARARVLVCTSASEGGPRVTCEAMACEVPVVSTPVGVMPERIEHGVNGLLCDWDADDVADCIARVLDDPAAAAAMGARGRAAVLPFERRAMLANYADELKKLAAQARGAR